MAATVRNAGLTTVKIKFPSGSIETLGYTRNGAEVGEEAHYEDVHGDENGGDAGPPIDIQYLGAIARIRLDCTKFDIAVINKIRARLDSATLGTPGTAGTFMFGGAKDFRLILDCTTDPRNFPRVICREEISSNLGTKYQAWSLTLEAHKNGSGVLWDTTTT